MANYGRLGPAGALRYCRSVSIDFEEEPSTQETEQREQALLQKLGFYDDVAFFRVIGGFMAQFGMSGDPKVTRVWQRATLRDDPVVESNVRGMLSFAKTGRPNSRTTQLFINLSDNKNLDQSGFSPFARVIEGMDVVDRIYKVGEGAPRGPGPSQQLIKRQGNAYLKEQFPKLDYIERATITE